MTKHKKTISLRITAYLIVVIISILLLEILSFSSLMFFDINKGKNFSNSLENRKIEFNNIFLKTTLLGNFDPIQQVGMEPGTLYGGYLPIGEFGYIENNNSDSDLNIFPEKKENLFRILMLGGSSTAGAGSKIPKETIPAQLELMLNKDSLAKGSKIKFQVLNYGSPGGYSGVELVKYTQYLRYLEPDAVITLDGFNDAWNNVFEKDRVLIPHPIINWADFSYKYYELLNGFQSSKNKKKPFILIPYTSTIFNKVVSRLGEKKITKENKIKFYSKNPFYKLSEHIYKIDKFHSRVFKGNLSSFASNICHEKYIYIGALQPHAYSDYESLTENEKNKLEIYENKYQAVIKNRDYYIKNFNPVYEDYKRIYQELENEFLNCKYSNFVDLTNIFESHLEDMYIDNIHYTPLGNKVLAEYFYKYIVKAYKTIEN